MTKNVFKKNDFIAIYTDVDRDSFGLGKVVEVDDNDIIIGSIDPSGLEDGLILYNISTICKIEKNTQYCAKIQKLMQIKNTEFQTYKFEGKSILQELLALAQNNKKFVEIELQNSHESNSFGIVELFDENICKIRQFDNYGEKDGIGILSIEDISSIKYDSLESRAIFLLTAK